MATQPDPPALHVVALTTIAPTISAAPRRRSGRNSSRKTLELDSHPQRRGHLEPDVDSGDMTVAEEEAEEAGTLAEAGTKGSTLLHLHLPVCLPQHISLGSTVLMWGVEGLPGVEHGKGKYLSAPTLYHRLLH